MTPQHPSDPRGGDLQVTGLDVELDADAGLVQAVQDLRLTLLRGETFALVGESGCGKSMTALALLRLLPDNGRITAGRIGLDGQDLLDLPEREMRRLRGGRQVFAGQRAEQRHRRADTRARHAADGRRDPHRPRHRA